MESSETPASRLKAARIAAGFRSAKAAAEAMGVEPPTYMAHENGGRGISTDRAAAYAEALGTTPEWILFGKPDAPGAMQSATPGFCPVVGFVSRMYADQHTSLDGAAGLAGGCPSQPLEAQAAFVAREAIPPLGAHAGDVLVGLRLDERLALAPGDPVVVLHTTGPFARRVACVARPISSTALGFFLIDDETVPIGEFSGGEGEATPTHLIVQLNRAILRL